MTDIPQHHHTGPAHDQQPETDSEGHGGHDRTATTGGMRSMALSATLHCLTGCAIGEIAGLMIGTSLGLSTGWTIVLAVSLAFLLGYTLSTLPLLRAGLGVGAAFAVVFAADTLSIATMEVVDNAVMALVPGAMDSGLVNVVFWISMMIALTAAFVAAYPVNRYLMERGKGHALTHRYHAVGAATGARRFIPALTTSTLVAAIVAFMVGGLVVSAAARLEPRQDDGAGPRGPAHAGAYSPYADFVGESGTLWGLQRPTSAGVPAQPGTPAAAARTLPGDGEGRGIR